MTTDLLTLDRKLALAARSLDTWRAALAVDDSRDRDDALAGWPELTSKSTLEAIAKSGISPVNTTPTFLLPDGEVVRPVTSVDLDPLAEIRGALVNWCAHLHIARGLRDATAARASAARDERESDSYGKDASMRAMLRALARPRQAGGIPEPRAAAAIEDLSPQLLDFIVDEEHRRREAADLLGAHAKCCFVPDAEAARDAEAYLADTADEAKEALAVGMRSSQRSGSKKPASWVDVLAVRRAADVADGWPASLSARWFAELARGTELVAGFDVDVRVDAGRLQPRADHAGLHLAPPTGAWTFARALYALGAALRIHGRDAKAPFAPHTLPHDRRPFVLGEAFLSLPSTLAFHSRARGVARAKAELATRRLSATRLLERRHLALRVRLSVELANNKRSFVEAFEALAPDVVGECGKEMAAFLGAPCPTGPADDVARFRAFKEGDALGKQMTDRFDDDWWRNPKAASWIRERCARS